MVRVGYTFEEFTIGRLSNVFNCRWIFAGWGKLKFTT